MKHRGTWPFATRYQNIIEQTFPYLLTFPGNVSAFNLAPWDIEIPQENIYSCIDSKRATFFQHLQTLDQLSFGPVGMPMERWVFFDCGEMPGAVFGFALKSTEVPQEVLDMYRAEPVEGELIPISMYIAIPMAEKGSWFGHNLSSVGKLLKDHYDFEGLGIFTKAMALKVYNIRKLYGATQWNSSSLNIHLQLADMELWSAYTPAHSFAQTMTYLSHYNDEVLQRALNGTPRIASHHDFLIESEDEAKMIGLQAAIEKGERYKINGRPIKKEGKSYLPITHI